MKDILKISVITPSYNSSTYLEDAVQSVLIQDYPDFEHIIVDGGSTDGTLDILKKYDHLTWISEPDKGQSDAMNKGFRMSTGDIIVYLNADDYFLPDAFNRVIPYFKNGAKFVVGAVNVVREDGACWLNDARVGHDEMLRHWEKNAFCVNPVGYFYLREVQENSTGFNLKNELSMDLEFLLECSSKYTFTKMKGHEPLGVFRFYENTKTGKSNKSASKLYTAENFGFIDKFLAGKSSDYISEYNRQRQKAFRQRIRHANLSDGSILGRLDRYFFNLGIKLEDFSKSPEKAGIIKNFIKRNLGKK